MTRSSPDTIAALRPRFDEVEYQIDLLDNACDWGAAWAKLCGEHDELIDKIMALRPCALSEATTLAHCLAIQLGRLVDFDLGGDRPAATKQIADATLNLLIGLCEEDVFAQDGMGEADSIDNSLLLGRRHRHKVIT